MDKERKWVEGSVHEFERAIWTKNYVLWTHKLFSDISNDNEQDLVKPNQYWGSSEFH